MIRMEQRLGRVVAGRGDPRAEEHASARADGAEGAFVEQTVVSTRLPRNCTLYEPTGIRVVCSNRAVASS